MRQIAAKVSAESVEAGGLLRTHIGAALRRSRMAKGQTLRQLSRAASVSLGYLSEIERGQKEASSELLAAICDALALSIPQLLLEVSQSMNGLVPAGQVPSRPALAIVAGDTTKMADTVNIEDAA